ncbi:MAG: double-strand break repair protein AddB [Pseudomonadota bacterium]
MTAEAKNGTAKYRAPTIFTVPAGEAILPLFARALSRGEIIPGFSTDGGPLTLSCATIYVPTRRAARELRSAFVDTLRTEAALLPQIVPLGEFDEDAAFFSLGGADQVLQIQPAVNALERQIILGSWVAKWARALSPEARALVGDDLETPVSTADAFWMARDLASLLDQMQTEEISFADLDKAADVDISDWWKLTHAFLAVIREHWPAVLQSMGRIDPATRRNQLLEAERRRVEAADPENPFIVIGSTGTIPATSRLIKTIASHAKGAVILPGYEHEMDVRVRETLEANDALSSAIGHPQYGMHKLVRAIGAGARGMVTELTDGTAPENLKARRRWVATSLAPSTTTDHWQQASGELAANAFDDVAVLHAKNTGDEALAIACALREAILDPATQCAFVTPDRSLARRVCFELARFGIEADDSGGTPFSKTPQGILLALALNVACEGANPNELLALLRQPLVQLGMQAEEVLEIIDLLELYVLRGGQRRFYITDLAAIVAERLALADDPAIAARLPANFPRLTDDKREKLVSFAGSLSAAVSMFRSGLDDVTQAPVHQMARKTIALLEKLACDNVGILPDLYNGEAGEALSGALEAMCDPTLTTEVSLAEWPGIISALMARALIKPDYGGHPRISIWGALEARLQHVDFMVLGGLNEGSWPTTPDNDAFVTRGMKQAIGMEPPERRVGLAAHDFQMCMGAPRVLLTRTSKQDGSPTVASRWIQRLETVAGPENTRTMRDAGNVYSAIAEALSHGEPTDPIGRPTPRPPLANRPKQISVTAAETLRRDPYAIYAKQVLKLKPLEPVLEEPDARTRGTLIHDCAEAFIKRGIDFSAENAEEKMLTAARDVFDAAALPEDIDTLWWARMRALIPELARWEKARSTLVTARHAELTAVPTELGETGVKLYGRGDRFDVRADGRVDIIDIKTGGHPSINQVQHRFAPQLPLEAALLARGAFPDLSDHETGDLMYVKLGTRGDVDDKIVGPVSIPAEPKKKDPIYTASELAERDFEALTQLVAHFQKADTAYLSWPVPEKQKRWSGDYDHLARIAEWGGEADGSEGSGDG